MVFYVGHGAYVGSYGGAGGGYTWLDRTNPCNGSGTLTYFEIYPQTTMSGLRVATYTKSATGTYDYWINAAWSIGSATGGSKQTFTGLSLNVITNDIIGIYYTSGTHYISSSGGSGDMYYVGDLTTNLSAGNEAIARAYAGAGGYTYIDLVNPVSVAPSKITTFEFYFAQASLGSVSVGIFTNNGGGSFTCTTSMAMGAVSGLSKQTYTGFDFVVSVGQCLGVYGLGTYFTYNAFPTGWNSLFYLAGNHCVSEGAIGGYSANQWQMSLKGHNNLCRYSLSSSVSSLSFSAASEPYSPPHVSVPILTTEAASSVTKISCVGNGTITDIGGENCSRRGFCYMVGTTGNPTTANSAAYDDGSFTTGAYTKAISGLTKNTNYRVRAYANNSAGTGYGATVQITTLNDVANTKTVTDGVSLSATLKRFPKAVKSQAISMSGSLKKTVKPVRTQAMTLASSMIRRGFKVLPEVPFVIDVGSAAIDRGSYSTNAYTFIDLANPVNASGKISTIELWFDSARPDATGVLCGTFYGSGLVYTNRAYVSIGAVTKGAKQTFSGLSCEAKIGDFAGVYCDTGGIETDISGGSGIRLKAGNQFGAGTQTYNTGANYAISMYAYGLSTYNVDRINRSITDKKVETAVMTANAVKKALKPFVLGISIVSTGIKKTWKYYSESSPLADSIKRASQAVKSQTMSMLDLMGRYYQRVLDLETEVLSDVMSTYRGIVFIEIISLASDMARAVRKFAIDYIANTDTRNGTAQLVKGEVMAVTDYISRGYRLVVNSSMLLSDSIIKLPKAIKEQIVYLLTAGTENGLFTTNAKDVFISSTDSTWELARSGNNLVVESGLLLSYIISMHKTGANYILGNSLLYFDTRYLPPNAELISANLKLYSAYGTIVENFDIVVQNGQPSYPHDPAVPEDFHPSNYSGNGGSKSAISWIGTGWNTIALNATGLLWINKGDITRLSIMSSSMINDVQPAADYENIIAFYDSHDEGYEGLLPILEVEYFVHGGGIAKAITTARNDIVTMFASLAVYFPIILAEMISLSESIVKKTGAVRREVVSMAGIAAKSISAIKSQNISITGKLEKSRALILTQVMSLSEVISRRISAVRSQVMSVSGSLYKAIATTKSQSMGIDERFTKTTRAVKSDAVSLVDNVKRWIAVKKTQTVSLSARLGKFVSKRIADVVTLSTLYIISRFYSMVRDEIVVVSDSIKKRILVSRADLVVVVERMHKNISRLFVNSIVLLQTFYVPFLRVLNEGISNTDAVRRVSKKVLTSVVSLAVSIDVKHTLRTIVLGTYKYFKFLGF